MHAEDFFVNDGGYGKAIEAVRKGFPQLYVVPPLALVIEPIDSVNRGTFMVTSEDKEILGILDLVGQQYANGLKGLLPSVYVVPVAARSLRNEVGGGKRGAR